MTALGRRRITVAMVVTAVALVIAAGTGIVLFVGSGGADEVTVNNGIPPESTLEGLEGQGLEFDATTDGDEDEKLITPLAAEGTAVKAYAGVGADDAHAEVFLGRLTDRDQLAGATATPPFEPGEVPPDSSPAAPKNQLVYLVHLAGLELVVPAGPVSNSGDPVPMIDELYVFVDAKTGDEIVATSFGD